MHPNGELLTRLFTSLDKHDHKSMADCYDEKATFSDIAFDLRGRTQIHAMWHMISDGDIRTTFKVDEVDDHTAFVSVVDDYTFRSTGHKVHNKIESHFRFANGLIVHQRDACDPGTWAAMALGGVNGLLAGRIPFLRHKKARKTLDAFIATHPQYQ
jgi:ketosteroid isomerase-like protein